MTVTNSLDRTTGRLAKAAAWAAFGIAVMVTLQGGFILIIGEDRGDRTLAITVIAVGLQTSLLTWFALRKDRSVAPAILWVFPAMLLAWAIHFLVNDERQIGVPNLVFAVLSTLGVVVGRTELTD